MKYFRYFWLLFILYFVVAHPAIIYYASGQQTDLESRSPVAAMIYLSVAAAGWAVAFIMGLVIVYKYTFGLRAGMARTLSEGSPVTAEVERVIRSKKRSDGYYSKELMVGFDNFSHQRVRYQIALVDRKPELNRYEPGRQVPLRIDKSLKYMPYVIIEGVETRLRPLAVVLGFGNWLLLAGLFLSYVSYAYRTESRGYGWRFLSYHHPLIMSLIILLATILVGYFLVYRLIIARATGGSSKRQLRLLLFGDRATALVAEVSQTGTYINEQPEIRYDLHFTDRSGQRHNTRIKKVVSLLDLHQVQAGASIPLFYLPDDPGVTAFEEDIVPAKI